MSEQANDAIWDAAEAIRNAMLVTKRWGGDGLHARPMAAYVKREEQAIWFITDRTGTKDDEVRQDPHAAVTFTDGSRKHVAFSGTIAIVDDRARLRDLWSPGAQAYYPQGPEDPNVIALRFTPAEAEYWEGPGTVGQMARMAAALATGRSAIDLTSRDGAARQTAGSDA